jgi:hypothetical protein
MQRILKFETPDNRIVTGYATSDDRFVVEVAYGDGIANRERIAFELTFSQLAELWEVGGAFAAN